MTTTTMITIIVIIKDGVNLYEITICNSTYNIYQNNARV